MMHTVVTFFLVCFICFIIILTSLIYEITIGKNIAFFRNLRRGLKLPSFKWFSGDDKDFRNNSTPSLN
jgi:hypothetical protein